VGDKRCQKGEWKAHHGGAGLLASTRTPYQERNWGKKKWRLKGSFKEVGEVEDFAGRG